MEIVYRPIGIIRSPFTTLEGMPIQPTGAAGVRGTVEVREEYVEGLRDLDGFSHVTLLYHFHEAGEAKMIVTPFLDDEPHGVFATRAPRRPNGIGLSTVKLLAVDGGELTVEGVDVLDGTPLLDIKVHVPKFDQPVVERVGWLAKHGHEVLGKRSDDRFL